MFRELMGDTIQEMLNSELDEKLGYEKYDQSNKKTENSRNGFSEKSMRSEYGDVTIKIPYHWYLLTQILSLVLLLILFFCSLEKPPMKPY